MPNYTHRPLPVFALQYTGDNAEEITTSFKNVVRMRFSKTLLSVWYENRHFLSPGEYILRDQVGTCTVMGKEEFEERYKEEETSNESM